MVHLHFFRDMMRPTQETFTRRALPSEEGKPQRFELTSAGEQSVELQRETVAVISVPIHMASQLADILNKAASRTGS